MESLGGGTGGITTNSPLSLLRSRWDKMMSEVLVRAGIVDADKDLAWEAIGQSSSGFFVLLAFIPLVLIACCVYRR